MPSFSAKVLNQSNEGSHKTKETNLNIKKRKDKNTVKDKTKVFTIDLRKSRERILNIAQKTRKEKEEETKREEERSLIF